VALGRREEAIVLHGVFISFPVPVARCHAICQGNTHRLRARSKRCCEGANNRLMFYVNISVNLRGGEAGAQTLPRPHRGTHPAIAAHRLELAMRPRLCRSPQPLASMGAFLWVARIGCPARGHWPPIAPPMA